MLPAMRAAERLDPRYGWYLATAASWFAGIGLQQVMLPWLVVGELRASAAWTGAVQMATMLPSVFLLLPGGAVADRRDPRALLTGLHLLAALPALALGIAIVSGRLSIAIVLVAATAIGALNALSNPARDTLLAEVAGRDVARAVTGLTIAQFASQGLGMAAAGSARWLGTAPVLLAQAALVALGAVLVRGTPARKRGAVRHAAPGEYLAGLRFVLRSPLRAVLVLTCGIGFLFSASYNVALPVLVRDVYGGDVRDVSIVMLTFPAGTIAGSFVLLSRGGIRRKGRALLLSLAIAATGVIACGAGLPFPFVVGAGLVWGLAGAVFLNMGRTLFQVRAPDAERARVLAVNHLGFMAAGPLGALLSGFVAAELGPRTALVAFGAGMLALLSLVTLASDVARME
jgi:predicted MFS family arabinose efflux permease